MIDKATHTPLPYECFQDRSYYDMWCVRRVNEREWGKGFHLVNGEEAAALRDLLNTRAVNSHHDLIEALREAVAQYGKPGGPWNVPSDPGGWLSRAQAALTKAEPGHG